ncbi:AbrB/MazE/SpoVT family DNA-binding domain-containing protein [Candidatus Woesearchaeota archaeon]|nr:AbrB/MazE/SpoVT family DNA-binding domain-containing protein [Candidatus Woesearchaeota archaeon]
MLICKTRKWGSSLGIIVPKKAAERLHLYENQEVIIEIQPKDNVLKDLFGYAKGRIRRNTDEIIADARKELGVD